ncbi:unnamed protein product [Ectocarpus sp. CCAP 1310/34]|nr:unnamed protein product [Ectocarpus sp. CCAP 1310/34]
MQLVVHKQLPVVQGVQDSHPRFQHCLLRGWDQRGRGQDNRGGTPPAVANGPRDAILPALKQVASPQCQSRADGERPLASCDSGLDEVQRKHLRVGAAALLLKRHLFQYQGTVSAAFVLGGVDVIGEHIYQAPLIHEGGSLAEVEFTAMGSGSLAALSVLERGYRENLTEQETKELVLEGIAAGIDNDLGSGSNIDLCVITAEGGLEHHRGAWTDPGLDDDGIAARELPEGIERLEPNQLDASGDSERDGFDVVVGGEGGSGAWVGTCVEETGRKAS